MGKAAAVSAMHAKFGFKDTPCSRLPARTDQGESKHVEVAGHQLHTRMKRATNYKRPANNFDVSDGSPGAAAFNKNQTQSE